MEKAIEDVSTSFMVDLPCIVINIFGVSSVQRAQTDSICRMKTVQYNVVL